MDVVFCLYEYSGTFANLYRQSGYQVEAVDLLLGRDILSFDYKQYKNVVGVISHPPCTEFAGSGARWWAEKSKNPDLLRQAVRQVKIVLDIVEFHKPRFWFIENPVGRLLNYVDLGRPKLIFHPSDYAMYSDDPFSDCYTKKTLLWGNFTIPDKRPIPNVRPTSKMHKIPPGPEQKLIRNKTPLGFALAFHSVNK